MLVHTSQKTIHHANVSRVINDWLENTGEEGIINRARCVWEDETARFTFEKFREQYPLIALIVVLIFLYILTGYQSAKQQHQLTDTKKEMLDAKFRYMTISAQLTNTTRQSQIIDALKQNGSELQENRTPPVKIK